MTDITEITSHKMFYELYNDYRGGEVPPVSKDAWRDIYNQGGWSEPFLVNDLWSSKQKSSRPQYEVDFYKKARQATFEHLPSEEKTAFLREFRKAVHDCVFTDYDDKNFNDKTRAISLSEFKEMFNTLSAEEKKQMIGSMDSKEALMTKQFGVKYDIPEFKKIDISTLNPEMFTDKAFNFYIFLDMPNLTLNEMDFLIKGTGDFNDQILEKYINKAMGQAENGGAEKVLTLLQSRKDNALGTSSSYTKDMPEMFLDLAHSNPKIGSDLLAEAFRVGYRAEPHPWSEPKDSIFGKFGKDPMLQEAQAKNKARIDFNKLSKGDNVPLSEALLKHKEEHLDDILKRYQQSSRFANNNRDDNDEKVLQAAIKEDYLSDESRAKIAITLLKGNRINDSLRLVETCLDFACSAQHTGTTTFDELEKAMKTRLAPGIQSADEHKKGAIKANQELKNLQKQQEDYCRQTGVNKAINVAMSLQKAYKGITELDAKADKPYLSKEQAEELITRAINGEKVDIDLIEEPKGMKGLFTGSKEKERIQKQNEAIKNFANNLTYLAFPQRDKKEIKKIVSPSDRRVKLTEFETLSALQANFGHLLEEGTLTELKAKNTKKNPHTPNIYNRGEYDGDRALGGAQNSKEWEKDWNNHVEYVRGLAEKMKEFQSHRKETARERIKEGKARIAQQQSDPLKDKAKKLEGLQGEERISAAKDQMDKNSILVKKARSRKLNTL